MLQVVHILLFGMSCSLLSETKVSPKQYLQQSTCSQCNLETNTAIETLILQTRVFVNCRVEIEPTCSLNLRLFTHSA